MGQTADELRQEIDGKRQDATDKIEQLEQKVTGAADQVMQTKDQVKDQVMQTKEQVVDTVTQAKEQVMQFDWRKQVDEKPLVALGAAFIGGIVVGGMFGGDDDDRNRYRSGTAPSYGSTAPYGAGPNYPAIGESGSSARSGGGGLMASIRNAAKSTGLVDTINGMTSSFMSTLSDRVKQVANDTFPGMADKLQSQSGASSQASGIGAPQHPSVGGATGAPSMPSTSDYARSGELGNSLTNS
jgi:hypothetical protein